MGLDAQVAADRLVEVGHLDRQLGELDLSAVRGLGDLGQALVGLVTGATHRLEALGAGAARLELLAIGRVHRLLGQADVVGRGRDDGGEASEHLQVELQGLSAPGGLGALERAALEAGLDLGAAGLDEAAAFGELRLAPRVGAVGGLGGAT